MQTATYSQRFPLSLLPGFDLRPAGMLAETAMNFISDITVRRDNAAADGKSVVSLMSLEDARGKQITIVAEGPDAAAAIDAISKLFQSRFAEN